MIVWRVSRPDWEFTLDVYLVDRNRCAVFDARCLMHACCCAMLMRGIIRTKVYCRIFNRQAYRITFRLILSNTGSLIRRLEPEVTLTDGNLKLLRSA